MITLKQRGVVPRCFFFRDEENHKIIKEHMFKTLAIVQITEYNMKRSGGKTMEFLTPHVTFLSFYSLYI